MTGASQPGTAQPGTSPPGTQQPGTVQPGTPRARIKTGKASLIGGIAVGIAGFVLWTVVARELGAATVPWMMAGAVVSAGIGAWIRIADL